MLTLTLDYETFSEVELKTEGLYNYATDPSTEIICVAYKIDDEPTKLWIPEHEPSPLQLERAFANEKVKIVAHNAAFERAITKYVLGIDIPIRRWKCTAAKAAAHALPRDLEGACLALQLAVQKDMVGAKLIKKYCKPRKASKHNPATRWNDEGELRAIYRYCITDVDAERALDLAIPDLNEKETEIWYADQEINTRGMKVDVPLVKTILTMIETETQHLHKETEMLTLGLIESTAQRAACLDWLRGEGVVLPDFTADTIKTALKNPEIRGDARRLLEIRQAVSKTSTAKFQSFQSFSGQDFRIRDTLMYHGAGPGRWTGRAVQPQNFPRGTIDDVETALEVVKTGDLELVRLLYGDPMNLFSSCLRGMITASPGKNLFCADFASIEVRVLFWIARHEAGLNIFREGRDAYKEMATAIYSKLLEQITKPEREVGKRAVLGCGFGMGHERFGETCEEFGQPVSDEIAQLAVSAYREVHWPVPALWKRLEAAAILAVTDNKIVTTNRTKWFVKGRFLYCELPSGRRLAYCDPTVKMRRTKWGEMKPTLHHWGVNSLTKKWEETGTWGGVLTENVVQAVARDLMAEGLLRTEAAGYETVLTVHDELVSEREEGHGSVKEFETLMSELPEWAAGCPVAAEGWSGKRYKK